MEEAETCASSAANRCVTELLCNGYYVTEIVEPLSDLTASLYTFISRTDERETEQSRKINQPHARGPEHLSAYLPLTYSLQPIFSSPS